MKKIIISVICSVLYISGFAQIKVISGDFNNDGEITTEDVAHLVNVALGKEKRIELEVVNDSYNGHPYVDLGLTDAEGNPIYWATCNIGAKNPEDSGLYFAWGEITGYKSDGSDEHLFTWKNYKWMEKGQSSASYCNKYTVADACFTANWYENDNYVGTTVDGVTYKNKSILDPEDDAAHVNWGGDWRMPTKEDIYELRTKCTWTWTTLNKVNGYEVMGPNGNSIFLPAVGYRNNGSLYNDGSNGHYWSSSLYLSESSRAYILLFDADNVSQSYYYRYLGRSIRPVCGRGHSLTTNEADVAGTWYSIAGIGFTLNADGTTNYPGATKFIYLPAQKLIVFYTSTGYPTHMFSVEENDKKTLKLYDPKESCATTYYNQEFLINSITLSDATVTIVNGSTHQLTATISPSTASIPDLLWNSSDASVATVSSSGLITAKKAGTTTVSASAVDGTGVKATCIVTVTQPVTSISIPSTLKLNVGENFSLIASIFPSDASDKSVNWSSSDTKVVTVSSSGVITAVGAGTAAITCKAKDSSQTEALCIITVVKPDYVDLGLSVKWATCNLGATAPWQTGDYYAWGEITARTNQTVSNYKFYGGSEKINTKYVTNSKYGTVDNKTILEYADDAAYVNLGKGWCMPTLEEIQELTNSENCSWTWYSSGNKEFNGVAGYKVQSKKSGYTDKYIFLPAAGQRRDNNNFSDGTSCYCWSSTVRSDLPYVAMNLIGYGQLTYYENQERWRGLTIRPVFTDSDKLVRGLTLSKSYINMIVGNCHSLTAVLAPKDAKDRSHTWSTSDPLVATVSSTGEITAIAVGTATITCTATDGSNVSDYCTVKVSNPSYVDLGLSVKWADCNLGASSPTDSGDYFGWGNLEAKNYKHGADNLTNNDYSSADGRTVLEKENDAAYMNWGDAWRMPTYEELLELYDLNNCSWTWYAKGNTEFDGVAGYKVQSKKLGYTSRYIFLPAAGYDSGSSNTSNVINNGTTGYYYTASLNSDYKPNTLHAGNGSSNLWLNYHFNRSEGLSIRPVHR